MKGLDKREVVSYIMIDGTGKYEILVLKRVDSLSGYQVFPIGAVWSAFGGTCSV